MIKFKFLPVIFFLFFLMAAVPVGAEAELININTATIEELTVLPGIGPAIAERIVEHREQFPFEKPEDIMQVSGVGEGRYDQIKHLITVD